VTKRYTSGVIYLHQRSNPGSPRGLREPRGLRGPGGGESQDRIATTQDEAQQRWEARWEPAGG
jgi:hypothetical protein